MQLTNRTFRLIFFYSSVLLVSAAVGKDENTNSLKQQRGKISNDVRRPFDNVSHRQDPRQILREDDGHKDEPGPLKVGNEVEIRIDQTYKSDVIPEISQSGSKAKYTIGPKNKGSSYTTAHMKVMDLDNDCVMAVTGKKTYGKEQKYTMVGKGKFPDKLRGTFWMQHVKGDLMVIEVTCSGSNALEKGRFEIDKLAIGYVPGEDHSNSLYDNRKKARATRRAEICGEDDKENAICYNSSHPISYDRGRAVARLLIQGTLHCTGWLADADNHLVTNEHCIASDYDALNTDYEWGAEAPSCSDENCEECYPGTIFSGATFIKGSASLDYALLHVESGNPASTFGFLEIDNRAAELEEEIYIPQHPGSRAKEFGVLSSESIDEGLCRVNSITEESCMGESWYHDVGYMCDTEGGSSGSPVLATSCHKVIALHHCASAECENRGVPINLICSEICSLLGGCKVDDDCFSGKECVVDSCNEGNCEHETLIDCCGNDDCEEGENCTTCDIDCISGDFYCGNGVCEEEYENCISCPADCDGQRTGRMSGKFCCGGDVEGTNPINLVPCSDNRCTDEEYDCSEDPIPYCCGDSVCAGGETISNCATDCDS